jgi:hypothetical protein
MTCTAHRLIWQVYVKFYFSLINPELTNLLICQQLIIALVTGIIICWYWLRIRYCCTVGFLMIRFFLIRFVIHHLIATFRFFFWFRAEPCFPNYDWRSGNDECVYQMIFMSFSCKIRWRRMFYIKCIIALWIWINKKNICRNWLR